METSFLIRLSEPTFWIAVGVIVGVPLWWNVTARLEFKTKVFTKILCGHNRVGAYIFATMIIIAGAVRDFLMTVAMENQPTMFDGYHDVLDGVAAILMGVGYIFSLASTLQLGILGTYLGDYFGCLMDEKASGFPYDLLNNPMYDASVIHHLGIALRYHSPAGILLVMILEFVYKFALYFEEPYTSMIYRKREEERERKRQESKKSETLSKPRVEDEMVLDFVPIELAEDSPTELLDYDGTSQTPEPNLSTPAPVSSPRSSSESEGEIHVSSSNPIQSGEDFVNPPMPLQLQLPEERSPIEGDYEYENEKDDGREREEDLDDDEIQCCCVVGIKFCQFWNWLWVTKFKIEKFFCGNALTELLTVSVCILLSCGVMYGYVRLVPTAIVTSE